MADQRFYEGARVSLISLVSCASGNADYCLHLFTNDMLEESVNVIKEACRDIAHKKVITVTLIIHKLKEEEISILPIRRGSRMTYLRLMMPQLLPQLDEITYIDTDTLFLVGIENFPSNLNQRGILLAGALDYFACLENECHWIEELTPEERKSPYINTGICKMNLAAMREMELLPKALKLLENHPSPRYVDQSLLNFLCRGKIETFDSKYNFVINKNINCTLNKGEIIKNFHYIGKIKPWNGLPTTKKWLAVSYWHIAADIYSGGSGMTDLEKPPNNSITSLLLKFIFCGLGLSRSSRLYWADLRSMHDPSDSRSLARKKLLDNFAHSE